MAQQTRTWFFDPTGSLIVKGSRFLTNNKPTESTFRDLIDSVLFKTSDDKATSTTSGHVTLASEADLNNNSTTDVVTPSQLPSVSGATSSYDGTTMQSVTVSVSSTQGVKTYAIRVSDAFYNFVKGAGVALASFSQVFDRATNVSTSPDNLPVVEVAIWSASDSVDNTFDGTTIDVTPTAPTSNNPFTTYSLKLSAEFRNWLKARLDERPLPTPASATQVYVAAEGNDTTGNGSITKPFATISKAISVTPSKNIYVLAGDYNISSNLSVFTKTIFIENGVNINSSAPCLFNAGEGFKLSGLGNIYITETGKLLQTVSAASFVVEGVNVFQSSLTSGLTVLNSFYPQSRGLFNNVKLRSGDGYGYSRFNNEDSNESASFFSFNNSLFKGIGFKFDHNKTGTDGNTGATVFNNCDFYMLYPLTYILTMGAYPSLRKYHINIKNCNFDRGEAGSAILLNNNYTTSNTNPTLSLLNVSFTRCNGNDGSGSLSATYGNSIVNSRNTALKVWITYSGLFAFDVTADATGIDFRSAKTTTLLPSGAGTIFNGGIGNVAKEITDSNTFVEEKPGKLYEYSIFTT